VHTFVLGATVASLKHHKINTDWLTRADILLFNPSSVVLLARRGAAHAKAPIYCMSTVHEDRQCPRLLLLQPRWDRGWFKNAGPAWHAPPQSKPVWIKTPHLQALPGPGSGATATGTGVGVPLGDRAAPGFPKARPPLAICSEPLGLLTRLAGSDLERSLNKPLLKFAAKIQKL